MPRRKNIPFEEWAPNFDSYLLGEVFAFGESFDALDRLSSGIEVKGYGGAADIIDDVGSHWYGLSLTLGTDDYDDLQDKCKSWSKYLHKKYKRRRHLTQEDSDRIKREFSGYRERYLLRLFSATVIPIASLKLLNMNTLEHGAQGLFQPEVWHSISRGIKEDLSSAVVCLVVGEWTPSVMIGLRACEQAVREYYEFKTGTRLNEFKGWKELLDELLMRSDISRALIGHLDLIREKRNDAEHPGVSFTRDSAERILIQVITTIDDVYREMKLPSSK
jgi:hypothetical protein